MVQRRSPYNGQIAETFLPLRSFYHLHIYDTWISDAAALNWRRTPGTSSTRTCSRGLRRTATLATSRWRRTTAGTPRRNSFRSAPDSHLHLGSIIIDKHWNSPIWLIFGLCYNQKLVSEYSRLFRLLAYIHISCVWAKFIGRPLTISAGHSVLCFSWT